MALTPGEALAGIALAAAAAALAVAALAAVAWWLRAAQAGRSGMAAAADAARAAPPATPGAEPAAVPAPPAPPAPPAREASAEELDELVRAHAYARLMTLPEAERTRWAERRDALSRELGDPVPPRSVLGLVWRQTMGPLASLQYGLQDGPAWLVARHAGEERRLVDAYAEAHVDVLRAVARRRSEVE